MMNDDTLDFKAPEPEEKVSSSERIEKSGLFRRQKKIVEFPPKSIFIDYKAGTEKSVKESVKNDIFAAVKDLDWGKDEVTYRIVKVENHPRLDPGFVFEIQKNGDGGSYIDAFLELTKDPDVREVWIECTKNNWAFIELKNGLLDTSISPMPAEDEDVCISFSGKPFGKMKALFHDNYGYFYISLILFFGSVFSLFFSALFKYVLLDDTKVMVNKQYYTQEQYMPIKAMLETESTVSTSLGAVRYTQSKGWFFIYEEYKTGDDLTSPDDDSIVIYEQKVSSDGSLSQRVPVRELSLNGVPVNADE